VFRGAAAIVVVSGEGAGDQKARQALMFLTHF
jgi:hypothetical protein